MRFGLIACVVLLGMAMVAQGAITTTVDNQGVPNVSDGTTVYASMPGYTAYLITLVSDGGAITGVDMNGSSERGIFGPIAQNWGYTVVYGVTTYIPTVFSTVENGELTPLSLDSHLLFDPAEILPAGLQDEDNDGSIAVTGQDYQGMGTYLRGAFGLPSSSTTLPLLYLVIPDGQEGNVSGIAQVAVAGSAETVDVVLDIPEPASLSLLALAGLVVLRRR